MYQTEHNETGLKKTNNNIKKVIDMNMIQLVEAFNLFLAVLLFLSAGLPGDRRDPP